MCKWKIFFIGRASTVKEKFNMEWNNYILSVQYFIDFDNNFINCDNREYTLSWRNVSRRTELQMFVVDSSIPSEEADKMIDNGEYDASYEWQEDENDKYRKLNKLIITVRNNVTRVNTDRFKEELVGLKTHVQYLINIS